MQHVEFCPWPCKTILAFPLVRRSQLFIIKIKTSKQNRKITNIIVQITVIASVILHNTEEKCETIVPIVLVTTSIYIIKYIVKSVFK